MIITIVNGIRLVVKTNVVVATTTVILNAFGVVITLEFIIYNTFSPSHTSFLFSIYSQPNDKIEDEMY